MNEEKLGDLQALIGNVIRLAVTVEPSEAKYVCESAQSSACHAVLLEPRLTPTTRHDHVLNHRLLQAFVAFRHELEAICTVPGAVPPAKGVKQTVVSFGSRCAN